MCFFPKDLLIFRTLAFLCFPLVSVCVHIPGRYTPAMEQNYQSSERSQNSKEKTQYLINTPYIMPKALLNEITKSCKSAIKKGCNFSRIPKTWHPEGIDEPVSEWVSERATYRDATNLEPPMQYHLTYVTKNILLLMYA